MKQREFPWFQTVQAPTNAPQHVVAQCALRITDAPTERDIVQRLAAMARAA